MKIQKTFSLQLELTEREAEVLCALLGGVVWDCDGQSDVHDITEVLFEALDDHLPNRTISFCDLFTVNEFGQVVAK